MSRLYAPVTIAALFCTLAGACNTEMEDGYKPRSLSAGPTQRRAYYASPFTPEAEAGKQEKGAADQPARPGPGGGY